jgi:hypothetical protein
MTMWQRLKRIGSSAVVVLGLVVTLTVTISVPSYAAAAPDCSKNTYLLTFPAWYNGVVNDDCTIKQPDKTDENGLRNFALRIGLNIAEIILQLVVYGALVMIIKGGFDYMTSNGEEARMTSGKTTIRNAIVGMVIALGSVAIVRLVGSSI